LEINNLIDWSFVLPGGSKPWSIYVGENPLPEYELLDKNSTHHFECSVGGRQFSIRSDYHMTLLDRFKKWSHEKFF
jgi:hypothetical protein